MRMRRRYRCSAPTKARHIARTYGRIRPRTTVSFAPWSTTSPTAVQANMPARSSPAGRANWYATTSVGTRPGSSRASLKSDVRRTRDASSSICMPIRAARSPHRRCRSSLRFPTSSATLQYWMTTSDVSFDRGGPNRSATHFTNGWWRSANSFRKAQRLRKRSPSFLGFCLYTASHAQMPLKLRALIDFLKEKRGAC
jgi:hypothetical protein